MKFKNNNNNNISIEEIFNVQSEFNIPKDCNNKTILIIIIILLIFLSKIFDIVWYIGKAILFIIILYLINFINTDIDNKFTNICSYFNFIFKLIAKIISIFINFFNIKNKKLKQIAQQSIEPYQQVSENDQQVSENDQQVSENDQQVSENIIKTIEIVSNLINDPSIINSSNVKNFANIKRTSNKNTFF
jgi:hypothetical protein